MPNSVSPKEVGHSEFFKIFCGCGRSVFEKDKKAFSLSAENGISQKLSKLHDKAYKRIIGIYLK